MPERRVWARRPFNYDGVELDRGQVFELRGRPNDERLIKLGFFAELGSKEGRDQDTFPCSECGAKFMDELQRRAHGDKWHPVVPRSPQEQERFEDREMDIMERIAPLNVGQEPVVIG